MKRIKVEDLPDIITAEIIDILANTEMEMPVSKEWIAIAKKLSMEQRISINNRISEIQQQQEKARRDAMTEEEKADEAAKWERIRNDPDPYKFYGNMGQPETPQEYKNRYGVWPPGYNENDDENKK